MSVRLLCYIAKSFDHFDSGFMYLCKTTTTTKLNRRIVLQMQTEAKKLSSLLVCYSCDNNKPTTVERTFLTHFWKYPLCKLHLYIECCPSSGPFRRQTFSQEVRWCCSTKQHISFSLLRDTSCSPDNCPVRVRRPLCLHPLPEQRLVYSCCEYQC